LERKEKIDYIVEMMVLDKLQMKRKARQEWSQANKREKEGL
jgi:hypothetical protein